MRKFYKTSEKWNKDFGKNLNKLLMDEGMSKFNVTMTGLDPTYLKERLVKTKKPSQHLQSYSPLSKEITAEPIINQQRSISVQRQRFQN